MGGMPDAGSTRSALLSSMLLEEEDDPPCCMGWGAVGTEAGAPDRVPPIPVHRKQGDLSLGL